MKAGWCQGLTLRQNSMIQDEINGCFYQLKNAVNLIRRSRDKFKKFGAVMHPCDIVRAKTSALRSILTHPANKKGLTIY